MYGHYRNHRLRQLSQAAQRNEIPTGENTMTKFHSMLLASAATVIAGLGMTVSAQAADQILSGSVAWAPAQKLDGVVISAKREGSTITTSVYTDATGNYYFPPMAAGKYNV